MNTIERPRIHIYHEEGHFYPINPETGDLIKRIPSLTQNTIWAMSNGGYRVDTGAVLESQRFFWLSMVEAQRQLARGGYQAEVKL